MTETQLSSFMESADDVIPGLSESSPRPIEPNFGRADKWSDKFLACIWKSKSVLDHAIETCELTISTAL